MNKYEGMTKEQLLKEERIARTGKQFRQIHKELKKYNDRVLFHYRHQLISIGLMFAGVFVLPMVPAWIVGSVLGPVLGMVSLLISIAVAAIGIFAPVILYLSRGWFRWFYHDVMVWHMPDGRNINFDGCFPQCKCKWCGRDIMRDSQGNWFEI